MASLPVKQRVVMASIITTVFPSSNNTSSSSVATLVLLGCNRHSFFFFFFFFRSQTLANTVGRFLFLRPSSVVLFLYRRNRKLLVDDEKNSKQKKNQAPGETLLFLSIGLFGRSFVPPALSFFLSFLLAFFRSFVRLSCLRTTTAVVLRNANQRRTHVREHARPRAAGGSKQETT
jgi:hypothetical protein